MLMVAQLVEHQIVILAVVSSILICQPKGEVVHWQAQQTVNLPDNPVLVRLQLSPPQIESQMNIDKIMLLLIGTVIVCWLLYTFEVIQF
ncbi:uncharacterized protein METZ01_LOCUS163126 [marine metagenome]|uniref:Uncharacterized protein n=1 Tax=marine metagenome TaxID=408172 RepID=A0A382BAE3_9ZZZZ